MFWDPSGFCTVLVVVLVLAVVNAVDKALFAWEVSVEDGEFCELRYRRSSITRAVSFIKTPGGLNSNSYTNSLNRVAKQSEFYSGLE